MNFFPAEVESIEDGTARIAGDSVAPFGLPAGPLKPGAAVTIGVRPEHLTPPAEGDFMTAGVVELVERLGEASYAHVRRADEKMTAAEIRGRRTSLPANVCNCPRPSRIFTCPMRRVAGLRREVESLGQSAAAKPRPQRALFRALARVEQLFFALEIGHFNRKTTGLDTSGRCVIELRHVSVNVCEI
jgi:MalK OB fold domain